MLINPSTFLNNLSITSIFKYSHLTNPLLTHIQKTLKSSSQPYNQIKKVYILGNTSCDLDSFLSSYLLSFPNNFPKHKSKLKTTSPLYIPLINCGRNELSYRFDIDYLCKKYNINTNHLAYFPDEKVQQDLRTNKDAKVILVDHNKPDISQLKILHNHVVGVYDHHKDEGYCFKGNKYLKFPLGSCTTIILRKFYLTNPYLFKYVDPLLSVSAILLDTENFNINLYKRKWIKEDKDVFNEVIFKNSKYTQNYIDSLYQKLIQEKYNKRSNLNLGVHGILIKDKKNFKWINRYTNQKIRAGWSTLQVPTEDIIKKYGMNAFINEIETICQKNNYDLYIWNYNTILYNHKMRRNMKVKSFIIYNRNMKNNDFELMVSRMSSLLGVRCYKKEKIVFNKNDVKNCYRFYVRQAMSRKHFEPIIREYFQESNYIYKH